LFTYICFYSLLFIVYLLHFIVNFVISINKIKYHSITMWNHVFLWYFLLKHWRNWWKKRR